MPLTKVHEQLRWKAVCAIHEVAEEARTGPVRPTLALRFALAYLYAVSDGTRWPYDGFWREVLQPAGYVTQDNYQRGTVAHACLQAILRSVGIPATSETIGRLNRAVASTRKPNPDRAQVARSIRVETEHERDRRDPANQYHG